MNIKPLALTLVAAALLTPAAAFAAEPVAASFERAFSLPVETQRVAAPAVHASDEADALTVAFNQALWTRQAPVQYVSPAPLVASFERAFGLPAETQRVAAPAVHASGEVDALTVAFNQALWTRQAPAQYVSPAPLVASFERAFGQSTEITGAVAYAASTVHAGDAGDALTTAFNQALWTKQAPVTLPRYVSTTTASQTKRN